jgi:hypothetical protein
LLDGLIHRIWNGRELTIALNNSYNFRKRDALSNRETLIFLSPMYGYTEDILYKRQVLFLSAGIGREITIGRSIIFSYQGGPFLPVYGKTEHKTDIIERRAGFFIPLDLKFRFTHKIGR